MTNKLNGLSKNKTVAIAIAIFLMLSITASTMLAPTTSAHSPPWSIPTHAYINASPNPVGTGQSVEVIMWLNSVIDGASLSNNVRFQNYKITITAPDGTMQTQTFATVSDPTSAQPYFFAPTQVGTYTLNFTFPGQTYSYTQPVSGFGPPAPSLYINDTYLASTASTILTVQNTPIANYPTTPLPTSYWTRPIYGSNTNWYTVSSNWLGAGSPGYSGFLGTYNAGGNGEQLSGNNDLSGSLTGHIMWTNPLQFGGVVGGNFSTIAGDTFFEGSAYNQRFQNPIIISGYLYYTEPVSFAGASSGPTDCVNLQTGQLVWSRTDVPALSFGYVYDVQDPNQHGVYPPILISQTGGGGMFGASPISWKAYDAFTGNYMWAINNIPVGNSFTTALGPNGEFLIITLTNLGTAASPNWYLAEWNSSRLWGNNYSGASTSPPVVPPVSSANNVTGGWTGGIIGGTFVPSVYDYNVSVPYLNSAGATSVTLVGTPDLKVLLGYSGALPSTGATFMGSQSSAPYTYYTINIDQTTPSSVGTNIWHQTLNPPSGNLTVLEAGIDPVNRVFVENLRETSQYVGYSIDTGAKLWGPTSPEADLNYYGSPASGSLANAFGYGKMYVSAYAGIVYCYDTKTGNLLWTYGNGGEDNSTNSGLETPFAQYPTFVNAIGSGVVYTVTSEHTPESPLFKGGLQRAINATTGAEIWSISGYTGEFTTFSYAMADGYNTWFNGYDNQIYVVGRGPSATTVSAPHSGLAFGQPVVISGSVTDIATGTKQTQVAGNFANGVPASSDASMREWMGYVYQQQPEPTNFTGVPVQIAVLDSNGNHYSVGTTTTDASGTYRLTWTPSIAGNYTVFATFAGTNGYYPSYAEDGFVVMQEPTATTAPTPAPASSVETYFAPAVIGIILAIVIVGAVIVLLLRKRQ
jgi:hypothetical protein